MSERTTSRLQGLRVAVAGGSYAGVCAGLALRCAGADVRIYERSQNVLRVGGGIVVQPDFAEYLDAFGYARPETVGVPTTGRRFLNRDGSVDHRSADATFYTAWDVLLSSLLASFPEERYLSGRAVIAADTTGDGVDLTFEDDSTDRVDLLIGADGVGSRLRQQFEPESTADYAGYVGYRGLIPEASLSAEQLDVLRDHFVLYSYPHSHILCYLIPGEQGELAPGSRRLNWVWYITRNRAEFRELLTDRNGQEHRASIGPGEMSDAWRDRLCIDADTRLPPALAQAIKMTAEPFAQGIFDLRVTKMVHRRVVLLGDAACVVRPHTAAGTSKAAADAIQLAQMLEEAGGVTDAALAGWESVRSTAAATIAAQGKRIAAHGGLGGGG
ncbi:MAG: FAD-dependent monooxygenase [Planctomycetota bacterium]